MSRNETGFHGLLGQLVVYFASTFYDGQAGTDWHVANQLRRFAPLLYVDPPISRLSRFFNPPLSELAPKPTLEILDSGFARMTTYVLPGQSRPLLHRLVEPVVARATRSTIRHLCGQSVSAGQPVAGVVSSRIDPIWAAIPARRKLFYATDDLPNGADLLGVPRRRLLRSEARALRGADAVAVVSIALQQRYAEDGYASMLIPNGCSPDAYARVENTPIPNDVKLDPPIAGFVGYINDRIDLALLEAVAATGASLLIVGGVGVRYREAKRFEKLIEGSNVCWVGARRFEELPGYLRAMKVGLTPYADTVFNRSSFPLKTLEYLAAGRAVVSTPLPANEWLATDLIEVAKGASEYAKRVGTTLELPFDSALAERRRAFARQHSWGRRAAQIADLLRIEEGH